MKELLLSALLILFLVRTVNAQDRPLFDLVPAEKSGIHFSNDLMDTKEHSILIYSNYYGGAGVAIADLDNDGLQDIYFAGNLVDDRVYKNNGEFNFEDVSDTAGLVHNGAWSSGVIIGDVNNDGLADIYVTSELYDDRPDLRANKLYINKGDFKFEEQGATYRINNQERTRSASFIDYNHDGYLDIYLLNQPPNPGNYSKFSGKASLRDEWSPRLMKNVEGQYFEDVSDAAGIRIPCYPNSAVAADVDNDGWQDLYVTNDYDAPDFLFINNQDGTFTNVIDDAFGHISYYSMGVDIADINNDGLLDIMTLDMVAEDNYRQKANMGGMYPEAFWKLVNNGGHYQYMYNTLQLNHGRDHFGNIAQMAGVSSTDWSWSNLIADFDNDGFKDIHVTNGLLRDIRNSDMSKEFPRYVEELAADYMNAHPEATAVPILEIMDVDKALAMHPSIPLSNYAFRNNGDLTLSKSAKEWGLDQPSFSNGSAYGDLDNDGDLDLIISNINAEAFVYKNNTTANYLRFNLIDDVNQYCVQGVRIEISTDDGPQYAEYSTVRGMYSSSEPFIHFGLGRRDLVNIVKVIWPDGAIQTLQNVTANQTVIIRKAESAPSASHDLIEAPIYMTRSGSELGLDFIHQENVFDDFSRQVLLPHKLSQHGPAMAVGDVNGDLLDDIFVGGARDQLGQIYIQTYDGRFVRQGTLGSQEAIYEDVDALFFDYDSDGDLDLYVVSGGNSHASRNKNYLDRLYVNDGTGSFDRSTTDIPRILESGSCVKASDYDGDGDLDLFVGGRHSPWDYPSPSISRLLENVNGKLVDVTKSRAKDFIFNGMVTDASWVDYNQDGSVDLVVVGEWMPITFYKNTSAGFVEDRDISFLKDNDLIKTDGWWSHITAEDVDGDGDMDFICGNLGKNYKYKASQSEPFEVHYDDFDDNGIKDIVLSYYNFGTRYPLRGRSCSTEQIPGIADDFPSYDLFAQAGLSEVYDPMGLAQALHLESFMFESVVLYNNGEGQYEVVPLPTEAQISTINDLILLPSEGPVSLVTGGNMSQSEIETPKNDASVGSHIDILQSTNMQVISPANTGIYLPYDVRHMALINIKNKDHILVATNGGGLYLVTRRDDSLPSTN